MDVSKPVTSLRSDAALLSAFAALILVVHFYVGNGYGFHRDEFQFLNDALTVADADHLCCELPHNLPCGSSQQHFFYLHRPLHGDPRIVFHAKSHGSILAACYADTSLATITGHIMC